ncbi:hypothetical protein ZWY2020_016500 [Hordeum vulgare]|nr:hypothetical protein ZWY2020_016500 [Hordeum vulgare]
MWAALCNRHDADHDNTGLEQVWEDDLPPLEAWILRSTSCRWAQQVLCGRLFQRLKRRNLKIESIALLVGVELVKDAGRGSLDMIKHKCKRYFFKDDEVKLL